MTERVTLWSQCKAWTKPFGAPARSNAWTNASPHNGVRSECLMTTEFPDNIAGKIELLLKRG